MKKLNSPGWWLDKCFRKRADRMQKLNDLDAWRKGDPPAPEAVKNAREAFKEFEKESVTNWPDLIDGLMSERIAVRDIRTGASGDDPDEVAWGYWLASSLDVEFETIVDTMLWAGDAYGIITEDGDGGVYVTPEDPRDVVTFHDPIRQSHYRAAAKFLHDADEGKDYVYLHIAGDYFDDELARVFVAVKDGDGKASTDFDPDAWSWSQDHNGGEGQQLNHKIVPVVRLRNKGGTGEFEKFLPHLRRLNRLTFQRSIIILYQAFKQRAILSDVDDPDETAKGDLAEAMGVDDLEDVLTADPGSWFLLPSGTKVWESTQADIQGLSSALKDEQLSLAAVSRRPMGMFAPDNQSASGANFTREGLTFAVEDKQRRLRRFLIDVFHIMFLTVGDEDRADKRQIRVNFMPAERYPVTDKASATSQVAQVLPIKTILREIWHMSPDEISAVEAEMADNLLLFGDVEDAAPASQPVELTPEQKKAAADALGILIRAGVDPENAASEVGLPDLEFTGAVPVALRMPEAKATALED